MCGACSPEEKRGDILMEGFSIVDMGDRVYVVLDGEGYVVCRLVVGEGRGVDVVVGSVTIWDWVSEETIWDWVRGV